MLYGIQRSIVKLSTQIEVKRDTDSTAAATINQSNILFGKLLSH